MFEEFKAEMHESLQDFKREMKDYIRLVVLAEILNIQKEEEIMNTMDMLDQLIATNQIKYFDILEYAVDQTDGTALANTLNRISGSTDYAPGPVLYDVVRLYCRDTILHNQQLIDTMAKDGLAGFAYGNGE